MHRGIKDLRKDKIMIRIKSLLIILTLVLASGCFNNCCYAVYNNPSHLTYEQLTQEYPSMADYIAQTRKRIKNNWYPPVQSFENSATIILTINKKGELVNCYLSAPSPDEGFNNSLIEAAKKSRFSPLPDEVKGDSIDIDLMFNMQRRHISK